jgi:hypothetical protein
MIPTAQNDDDDAHAQLFNSQIIIKIKKNL